MPPEPNEPDSSDASAHPDLTDAARDLRAFLTELQHYLSGVSAQLDQTHRESESLTVKGYVERIGKILDIPYSEFIPSLPDRDVLEKEAIATLRSLVDKYNGAMNEAVRLEAVKLLLSYAKG